MFELIPALDLMSAQVVRARRGERRHYAPLRCQLCADSDPFAVLEALNARYSFGTVYIADLDAIRGRGHHGTLIRDLCARYPSLRFWVDQGPLRRHGPWRPVLGSESLARSASLRNPVVPGRLQPLLSLDFFGHRLQAPGDLWRRIDLWPRDIIAMQLRRVGSGLGPDLALMHRLDNHLRWRRGTVKMYAAGGVRNLADLHRLHRAGVSGALVAGILYDSVLDGAGLPSWIAPQRLILP